jgi:glycosyltransferase involved in cell wall biosynthesis
LIRCFEKQTWSNKELILIDEGPCPIGLPSQVRFLKVPEKLSIGTKLNEGVKNSQADFFHKCDDDDGYHPNFLTDLITPLLVNPSAVSLVDSHLVFLVKDWKLYTTPYGTLGGGSICFGREAWNQRQFQDLSLGEDMGFIINRKSIARITPDPLNYVLVRHSDNTWKKWSNGRSVEDVTKSTGTLLSYGPEGFFSPEDLYFYQKLRADLLSVRQRSPRKIHLTSCSA